MYRWVRWQLAKRRLASQAWKHPPRRLQVSPQRHLLLPENLTPDTEAYTRLAAVWDRYASWFVPEYGRFVAAAGHYYRQSVQVVLDLACGTGLLTRKLARRARSVVGLDRIEAMLQEARSRTSGDNVRFVQADFRHFCLPQTFDVVVCGCDSLNYVETPGELLDVFRCVRQHLRPGGLFMFDVLDDRACRAMARKESSRDRGWRAV